MPQEIIVICGPTASGKSALALELAKTTQITIINADSMQIYADIPVITAQPTKEEKSLTPHALYGILQANEKSSSGIWLNLVEKAITESFQANRIPVLVGGTGLYLKSLIDGISPMPEISTNTKLISNQIPDHEISMILKSKDPESHAMFQERDTQRQRRALEIFLESGKSIKFWQSQKHIKKFENHKFKIICLWPERNFLRTRCNERFDQMLQKGVIEEVAKLNDKISLIDPKSPILKAHGVPEIRAFLNQEISLQDASEKAKLITRQYAKRQFTWFKHQLPTNNILEFSTMEEAKEKFSKFFQNNHNNFPLH